MTSNGGRSIRLPYIASLGLWIGTLLVAVKVDGGLAAALRDALAEKQPAESVKSEDKLGHPEKIGATEA